MRGFKIIVKGVNSIGDGRILIRKINDLGGKNYYAGDIDFRDGRKAVDFNIELKDAEEALKIFRDFYVNELDSDGYTNIEMLLEFY